MEASPARRELADEITGAVREHPLAPLATGTVVVGIGAPTAIDGSDAAPRILIPMAWPEPLDRVQRAQLAHADAIIAIDAAEQGHIASATAGAPVPVVTSSASGADTGFLPSAVVFDAMEAITVISDYPELSDALRTIPLPDLSTMVSEATADAVFEALVLKEAVHG